MKIFLSYAYNDHPALVKALMEQLRADGHQPWTDPRYSGNGAGGMDQELFDAVQRGIEESDCVLALKTLRTRDNRACLADLKHAREKLGAARIIALRLDGLELAPAEDSNTGDFGSVVDMDVAEQPGGSISIPLLRLRLGEVYRAYQDSFSLPRPDPRVEKYLKISGAEPYEPFIAIPEQDDFVGRQWLMEQCRRWAADENVQCRLFVILGEAGTGKTAFVRRLAADRVLVRSVHVCVYDGPSTRNITALLKNLAYLLARNNRAYSEYLRARSDDAFRNLDGMDYDGLFEWLFIDPLKNEQEKYLLLIDGLDELEETTGLEPLIQLLRRYADRLNPNISILVTARPEGEIVAKLRTVPFDAENQTVQLDLRNSREDLCTCIQNNLQQLGLSDDALQRRILEACDGNFEYLTLLFQEAKEDPGLLAGDIELPKGLTGRYIQYLDRRMKRAGQQPAFTGEQHKWLSVLGAAYEPVSLSLLCRVTGLERFAVEDELRLFGSLIRTEALPDGDYRVSFYSKGFRDFLFSGSCRNYRIDARVGNTSIAVWVLENCRSEAALKNDPYLDKYAFLHLLLYLPEARSAAGEYFAEMRAADRDGTDRRLTLALCSGEKAAVTACFSEKTKGIDREKLIARLQANRAIPVLFLVASAFEDAGYVYGGIILRAELLRMQPSPENLAKAEKRFHKLLVINKQICEDNPCYESRHDLAVTYDRLGDLALSKATPEGTAEAEEWFRKKLELAEANHRDNPCYESRRSLAATYDWLGDLALSKATPEGTAEAEDWFGKELELDEATHRDNPCYESRRDLAITYERLGNLALSKATPEGTAEAEDWFRKKLELDEANHRKNPCYESRRNLAITYERLGNLALSKATPEGTAEAEEWFRKELELSEVNYLDNPCYESRRSLAATYDRLGELALSKATPEGTAEAEEWFRKKLELDEANHRDNPCYESRRDLAITYERLGDLALSKATEEGTDEAENWFGEQRKLAEANHRDNPCYESRRNLAITYERLGDLALSKATPEGTAEAENWFREERKLMEANYDQNPDRQSISDLRDCYTNLCRALEAKATPEALAEAKQLREKIRSLPD